MPIRPPNHRLLAAAGACVALAAIVVPLALATVSAEQEESRTSSEFTQARVAALASCSNSNCHGGTKGEPWAQAYTLWATEDPHADAYAVLYRSASRKMVAKLSGDGANDELAYQQFVDANCAGCHATNASPIGSPLAAGVSCGSCHGDAENWLDEHLLENPPEQSQAIYGNADSPRWSFTNEEYGLRDMQDEVTRARTCVVCHVGSAGNATMPRREVNHDLIAAGHPRLVFEQTSHLANMPHHWKESTNETASYSWAIGQLVAADAAVELLLARVESGVWPEFSEYNCASCHHSLKGIDSLPSGTLYDWGSWYFPLLEATTPDANDLKEDLTALRRAMSPLIPRKEDVKSAAKKVRVGLQRAIANLTPAAAKEGFDARMQRATSASLEWDTAVQRYLWHAHRLAATGSDSQELRTLFHSLQPSEGKNGPLWLRYDTNPVHQALKRLDNHEKPKP